MKVNENLIVQSNKNFNDFVDINHSVQQVLQDYFS